MGHMNAPCERSTTQIGNFPDGSYMSPWSPVRLRVEELVGFLALDFEAGQIPKFHEDWFLEDPVEAVLSTCSTLLSPASVEDSQVIQFSYFSVKEYLTSTRFAEKVTLFPVITMFQCHLLIPWLRKHAWVFYCTWMKMSPTMAW
jgi:hypothetical protein